MGEYWKPVNITKREYIHPHDLNDGLKFGEWTFPRSATMTMIKDRWSPTDAVVYVGDYGGLHHVSGEFDGDPPTYDMLDELGYSRISRRS